MRRPIRAVLAVVLVLAACTDAPSPSTAPRVPRASVAPTGSSIENQIKALFAPGSLRTSVLNQFGQIFSDLQANNTAAAQQGAVDLSGVILQSYNLSLLSDPNAGAPPTTEEAVGTLIDDLYVYTGMLPPGLTPGTLVDGGAKVIGPAGGQLVTNSGLAGFDVPSAAVPSNVLFVITRLPDAVVPGNGPLPTTIDQWGPFYEFHTFPNLGDFAVDVERAICTFGDGSTFAPPELIHSRLRLAHPDPTNPTTIEILPKGSAATYLDCSSVLSDASDRIFDAESHTLGERARHYVSRLGRRAVSLVSPTVAYATHAGLSGIGKNASPHGAVDPLDGATFIDFETYPDNSPSCALCALKKQYSSLRVTFRYLGPGVTDDNTTQFASTVYDPPAEAGNHSATAGRNSLGQFVNGTFRMLFPTTVPLPKTVTFRLRGPNSVATFPVGAANAAEQALTGVVTRTNVHTYLTSANVLMREETITVASPGGILRVDVGMNGFVAVVDNLSYKP